MYARDFLFLAFGENRQADGRLKFCFGVDVAIAVNKERESLR